MGDLNTHPIPHLTYKETEAESDYRNWSNTRKTNL